MNILVVAYYFAPSTCANAKRPLYFVRGLLEAGCEVEVVCSTLFVPPGSPEVLAHPRLTIRRVEDPAWPSRPRGPVGRLLTRIGRWFLWPDSFVLWVRKVRRGVRFSRYDRILVSASPVSPLLLLLEPGTAKRATVDYQDIFSPDTVILGRAPLYRLLLPLLTALQRRVLRMSAGAIFATRSYFNEYVKHGLIDPSKAVHVPFFYDSDAFKAPPPPSGRFVISYPGQFGRKKGIRSPEVFFSALRRFLDRNPEARGDTAFDFYGPWIEEHSALVEEFGLQDVVRIHRPVPYTRYLEVLSESHVLLLIASREQNFFVPSKMLDYFGARRPILGFVPADSETFGILQAAGMDRYVSGESDAENGARCLERLWRNWKEGGNDTGAAGVEPWSSGVQVPRAVQWILRSPDGGREPKGAG